MIPLPPPSAIEDCIKQASQRYEVDAERVREILIKDDLVSSDKASKRYQRWKPILISRGFTGIKLETNSCYRINSVAWILAFNRKPISQYVTKKNNASHFSINDSNWQGCIKDAAHQYGVHPKILQSILRTEGGRPGLVVKNRNGSYDYGVGQINSVWIERLNRLGYSKSELINDPCRSINAAALILSSELQGQSPKNAATFWRRIGNYHSHTPFYNVRYQLRVWRNLR